MEDMIRNEEVMEETKVTNIGLKDDCFAYDKIKNQCKALNNLYCRKEKCNFYKTDRKGEVIKY